MSSFCVWTIVVILYQTAICVVISWLTLQCRLVPQHGEPRELTLMKLLYLYDPQACGRKQFYNQTLSYEDEVARQTISFSTILWPETNGIAAAFRKPADGEFTRRKIQLWLGLHLVWLALALVNASLRRRLCAFYAALLPLTAAGLALLVLDVVHTALFLRDAARTGTEKQILDYIRTCSVVHSIHQETAFDSKMLPMAQEEDTSWVALLLAYVSCRGVVQWIVNFWIVQDNFLEGLSFYRSTISTRRVHRKMII